MKPYEGMFILHNRELPEGEMFIIISEYHSWNDAPNVEYMVNNALYFIVQGKIYDILGSHYSSKWGEFEMEGLRFQRLAPALMMQLITG